MAELTKIEIRALARAVGLEIDEPDLTAVSYQLNAMLEAMESIQEPGLGEVEPLPIIVPLESS
jgi:Asp-tRNA(Asn)/Glu-tRNA(Gln) amidotransferase C subunit